MRRAGRQRILGCLASQPADVPAQITDADVSLTTTRLADGRLVVHVINHAYDGALSRRSGLQVTVNTAVPQTTASVASPELVEDVAVDVGVDGDATTFELPAFSSYVAVVLN